jgi:hypothetical protein
MELIYKNPNPPQTYKPLVSQFKPAEPGYQGEKHYIAIRPNGESYFALVAGGIL